MVDKDRIAGTVQNTVGKVEKTAGDLVGDSKTEGEGLVDKVAGVAQNAYGQAKDAVRGTTADAPEHAALDMGERYYREGSRAVSRSMGDDPLMGLLVAGAAGYALAWFIHGRR